MPGRRVPWAVKSGFVDVRVLAISDVHASPKALRAVMDLCVLAEKRVTHGKFLVHARLETYGCDEALEMVVRTTSTTGRREGVG